jgi:hypothetical protein
VGELETKGELEHISGNKIFSENKLREISQELESVFQSNDFSIVIAGSYGRLEASRESDFDYFILFDSETVNPETIKNEVNAVLTKVGIDPPNPDGVFSKHFPVSDLINNIGGHEDSLPKLGQRMLLLMESRAFYNDTYYRKVVERILNKYLEYVIKGSQKECVFLLNDLIRYFRSMAVNYEYTFWKESQKWTIRNIKLRHSRILIYAGILFLILEASKEDDKLSFFLKHIYKTPIEKIKAIYDINSNSQINEVLEKYNFFLGQMNSADVRLHLNTVNYENRHDDSCYMKLKDSSDTLMHEFSKFAFDSKRNNWSNTIMEYLIF